MEDALLWKDFAEEESCDNCPILAAEICPGGWTCYGGEPIEPPCCSFDDDTDLNEWVSRYYDYQNKSMEEYDEKRKREGKKKERAKKAAVTRNALRAYCYKEYYELKQAKKELREQKATEQMAISIAEAFNFANEIFRYEERYHARPEISERVKLLDERVAQAQEKYAKKRKEFYDERKKKNENTGSM